MFLKRKKTTSRTSGNQLPTDRASRYSYASNRSDKPNTQRNDSNISNVPGGFTGVKPVKRTVSFAFLIILIIAAFWVLWLSSTPKVSVLNNTSSSFLKPVNIYQIQAEKYLGSSIFNHNKLSVNLNGLENYLKAQNPELYAITATLPLGGHTLNLYIIQSQPALELNNGQKTVIVSADGRIMGDVNKSNASLITKLNIPTVSYQNAPVSSASKVLSSGDVNFISYVNQEIKIQKGTVTNMKIVPGSRELDVNLAGTTYYIKFNLENNPKEQVGSYITLRQYLSSINKTPSQYIDLRVSGRAYYL